MEAEEAINAVSSSPPSSTTTTTTTTTDSETLVSEPDPDQKPTRFRDSPVEDRGGESEPTSFDQKEILRAIEIMERDSTAIASSFTSLFASLRLALSEATSSSVDHMRCFSDAAGQLQGCALDATTKGNRYINSCLRLNEEMKGVGILASQLKILRKNVDALDSAVNVLPRLP